MPRRNGRPHPPRHGSGGRKPKWRVGRRTPPTDWSSHMQNLTSLCKRNRFRSVCPVSGPSWSPKRGEQPLLTSSRSRSHRGTPQMAWDFRGHGGWFGTSGDTVSSLGTSGDTVSGSESQVHPSPREPRAARLSDPRPPVHLGGWDRVTVGTVTLTGLARTNRSHVTPTMTGPPSSEGPCAYPVTWQSRREEQGP